MLSAKQIKEIKKLYLKKHRNETGLFVAQTPKIIEALLKSHFEIIHIFTTQVWLDERRNIENIHCPLDIITESELERISDLKKPQQVLALVQIPKREKNQDFSGISLCLDDIRDPGNLGTIIRIADWFGIDRIFCTPNCTDPYQSKCVQASMGSIANIPLFTEDSNILLERKPANIPIYGMFLDGVNIYENTFPSDAIIIIGNEAHGISPSLAQKIDNKILIPSFAKDKMARAESLNAAMATAIVCSEIRRKS